MKSIFIIALSIFIFAFSCENKDEMLFPQEEIVGEWNWQYSVYYNTHSGIPYVLNPDTLGFTTKYHFNPEGEFSILRNSETEGSGIYWFESTENENDADGLLLFTQQDEFIKSVDFFISGDTLVIDETDVDGPKRYFRRINNL